MDSLGRLAAVAKKEALEIVRDPITLGIVLPVLMMFLFAYAITLDVRDIRLAVLDEDLTPESREYVASFLQSGYFRLQAAARDPREVERLLDEGAARVALVIPAGFSRRLGRGLPVGVQIVGRPFEDATVLRVGHAHEQATDWHRRRPAI